MDTKNVGKSAIPVPLKQPQTSSIDGLAAPKTQDVVSGTSQSPGASNFNVNLSPKAKEIADARAKATEIARNTPDVREDKVAEIKKKIADGTYKVDSGKIADGIAREAMRDYMANSDRE